MTNFRFNTQIRGSYQWKGSRVANFQIFIFSNFQIFKFSRKFSNFHENFQIFNSENSCQYTIKFKNTLFFVAFFVEEIHDSVSKTTESIQKKVWRHFRTNLIEIKNFLNSIWAFLVENSRHVMSQMANMVFEELHVRPWIHSILINRTRKENGKPVRLYVRQLHWLWRQKW